MSVEKWMVCTVKPRFSVPTFSEFLYLVNILSVPGQRPINTVLFSQ
jgi:hypothetical protein